VSSQACSLSTLLHQRECGLRESLPLQQPKVLDLCLHCSDSSLVGLAGKCHAAGSPANANTLSLTCFTSLLANASCKLQATNTATSQQQARCCAGDIGTQGQDTRWGTAAEEMATALQPEPHRDWGCNNKQEVIDVRSLLAILCA